MLEILSQSSDRVCLHIKTFVLPELFFACSVFVLAIEEPRSSHNLMGLSTVVEA